jgi:hypothetical protein
MEKWFQTSFDPITNTWEFGFKENDLIAVVKWKEQEEMKFQLYQGARFFSNEETEKIIQHIKQSKAFKETMNAIQTWENDMRNALKIDDVTLLKNDTLKESGFYLVSFQIKSLIAEHSFELEKGKEHILSTFDYFQEDFLFILALKKEIINGKIRLTYTKKHPMKWKFAEGKNEKKNQEISGFAYLTLNEARFATHRTFGEDLAALIEKEASIRIKLLVQ